MKKLIVLLFVSGLFIVNSRGQDFSWNIYAVDSLVKVGMPGDVYEVDTIFSGMNIHQLQAEYENSIFTVQKVDYLGSFGKSSGLPYNKKSLMKFYKGAVEGLRDASGEKVIQIDTIEAGNYIGYLIVQSDKDNKPVRATYFLVLENFVYSFIYQNYIDYKTSDLDLFVNSISINSYISVSQYTGNPKSDDAAYLMGRYSFYILLILLIIGLVFKYSKKKKTPNTRLK